MKKTLAGVAVVVVAVVNAAGCASTTAQIPRAPPRSAPVEERVAWAEQYTLAPNANAGDILGNGTRVYDLNDLAAGIDNDALKVNLQTLEQPQNEQRLATGVALSGLAVALGAYVAAPFFDPDAADPTGARIVTGLGVGGVAAWAIGTLWAADAGARAEESRGRIRMFYSHMVEEELDVEITANGQVKPREPTNPKPQPTDPPAALPTTAPTTAPTTTGPPAETPKTE